MRVSAFPERVGPQILSRERVDNFGTSEHSSGRRWLKCRAMFLLQCNFSPIKALEFSCNYTRVQPATADVSPVVSNTLLRDGPFSFGGVGGGGGGLCTYQIKLLHKKFKRKKNHAQESTWKKIQACVLVEFVYEQVFKNTRKMDLESQEQTFIIIPPRLLK